MLQKTLSVLLFALASLQSASAQDLEMPEFSGECLTTTKEVNKTYRDGLVFESNMDDLVDQLGERVLYMRTTDLKIFTDKHYIHGMRVAMKHDDSKDPEHNENLDSYKSSETTILADHH